jgi:hypothetical protein
LIPWYIYHLYFGGGTFVCSRLGLYVCRDLPSCKILRPKWRTHFGCHFTWCMFEITNYQCYRPFMLECRGDLMFLFFVDEHDFKWSLTLWSSNTIWLVHKLLIYMVLVMLLLPCCCYLLWLLFLNSLVSTLLFHRIMLTSEMATCETFGLRPDDFPHMLSVWFICC